MTVPLLTVLGRMTMAFLEAIGAISAFALQAARQAVQPPYYNRQILRQMLEIGYYSLPVVGLTAIFTGMVLALQSHTGFARFSAESAIPNVVVVSLTRELGPVLAALMVAGRVGAAMAAEIGTMRVTEQIDALETLAFDPVAFLAVPRLVAALIMVPVLVAIANFVAIFAAFITLILATDVTPLDFKSGLQLAFIPFQIWYSIIKSVGFGAAIALVCTYEGYVSGSGAEGVGRSTAKAVVITSVAILVYDAIIAALLAPFIQA